MFNWINFIIYAFITSITPGPNNIMSMTNGKLLGIKKSIPFSFGVGLGVFIILLLSAWLASSISALIPKISVPMKVIGALYMVYLAYKTLTSKGIIEDNYRKPSIVTGTILQCINPKTYLYCIVSMEIYVLPYFKNQPTTIILFALLLSVFPIMATLSWAFFGKLFAIIFCKYAKITNTVLSILLLYCAVSLFL